MASLNHLHLHVRALEPARAFYETWFGMREHVRHGDVVFLRDDAGCDLALAPSVHADVFPPWFHFGFRLAAREGVADLHGRMRQAGATITQPLEDEGDLIYFRCADPDGHLIEVYWETQPVESRVERSPAIIA